MNDTDVITAARIEQTTFAGFPGASIVHVSVPSGAESRPR